MTGLGPAVYLAVVENSANSLAPIQSGGGMWQLFIYLILLVAALGGGLYFLRNQGTGWMQRRSKETRKLNISETRALGNRQFLLVADYEGHKMLLGVCPGRIDYLCPLGNSEGADFGPMLEAKEKP